MNNDLSKAHRRFGRLGVEKESWLCATWRHAISFMSMKANQDTIRQILQGIEAVNKIGNTACEDDGITRVSFHTQILDEIN